jgi:hypothetical protein
MQAVHSTVSIWKRPVSLTKSFCDLFLNLLSEDALSIIAHIHERKMKAGVAISPDTPSSAITDEIGNAADMLLVMTVYPGPQSFIRHLINELTSLQGAEGRSSSTGAFPRSQNCGPAFRIKTLKSMAVWVPRQSVLVQTPVGCSCLLFPILSTNTSAHRK